MGSRRLLPVVVVALVSAVTPAMPAHAAATFAVNSTADVVDAIPGDGACSTGDTVQSGDVLLPECTLRAAVQEANALAGADSIHVPAGTYTLTRSSPEDPAAADASVGDLDLTESVAVFGADDATTIVRAGTSPYEGIDRVFENWNGGTISTLRDLTAANGDPGGGAFVDLGGGVRNNGPAALTLRGVTVTGSEAYCQGGGIFNWNGGALDVIASTVSANRALGACGNGHAGGIRSEGAGSRLTLTDSLVEGNTAGTATGGVGVSGSGGTITGTTFRNNSAGESIGALFSETGLSIAGSRFEGNRAGFHGGAAFFAGSAPVSITDTEFVDNTAGQGGGAIHNSTTLTLERSSLTGNSAEIGGGLKSYDSGNVTIDRSTFSANRATVNFGGAIDMCCNAAVLSITNSTLSGNSAAVGGGGISVAGPMVNLTNVTVTGNSSPQGGSGINGGSAWNLVNTIVANGAGAPDCASPVSMSHSLIEDPTNCTVWDGGGNLLGVDPQLLSLADNGGETPTHALASTSPAVDAGTNSGCPPTDQRGVSRPIDGFDADTTATCDMGAVELTTYRLTVEKSGPGSGRVTAQGASIDCGTSCGDTLAESASVMLSATAAGDSVFAGWSGGGCSGTGTCTVTMDAAKTVTATFEIAQRALTVLQSGGGGGTVTSAPAGIDCGSDCTGSYAHGTLVTLTATPAPGSTFTGWSACAGTGPCTVTMDEARTVTATFASIPRARRTLSVERTGGGDGEVASSPRGIDCGSDCVQDYDDGATVTLTATPSGDSTFGSWNGCDRATGNECVVTMNVDTKVTVRFVAPRTLTVDKQGTGSGGVTSTPGGIDCGGDCTADYANGTDVVLTATPGDGSSFASWTGCDEVSDDECTISLTSDATVTVRFDGARVAYERRVTLFLGRHVTAHGRVWAGDGPAACTAGVPVRIQRRTSNGWVTVERRITSPEGKFRVQLQDRPDSYRVRAPGLKIDGGPDTCKNAISPVREHAHG